MNNHTGIGTDALTMMCHICGKSTMSEEVDCEAVLPPYKVIQHHEMMIRHVRTKHLRRRAK